MSVSASIDLRIVDVSSKKVILPIKTLTILAQNGWSLINQYGYAGYLPVNDNDEFNWQGEKINEPALMEILQKKEDLDELVGVNIYWQNTEIGGSILLWTEKIASQKKIHTPMSFICDGNRKILSDDYHCKITDVNWYLTKLLPAFNQGDTIVEYFTYEEHI